MLSTVGLLALCAFICTALFSYFHRSNRDKKRIRQNSITANDPRPYPTDSDTKESNRFYEKPRKPRQNTQLEADKALFYKLQNLEQFPETLQEGRTRLLQLLDETVYQAQRSAAETILEVPFSSVEQALPAFLRRADAHAAARFDEYLARRKHGGPREILPDRAYAEYWVRTAAPVKYVDGAWLGGIHRASTAFEHRPWTKFAWQILSEELGDGDLEKNHVHVYEKLVDSITPDIGRGDDEKFISNATNPNNDERVWTAAVSQLCVSLCPNEFLPEILGFNMAYESLPLHLLISIHELKELELDPYYFVLHIVIDNSDSGHAAMGLEAVLGLLRSTPIEEREAVWRRVQAGFVLAEGLPTTPTPPSEIEQKVMEVFSRKCVTARPMHMCCSAKLGGRNGKTLSQWLDPNIYHGHALYFLQALADSRWVVRGSPHMSKLIHELQWGGRMFGAFTVQEVALLKQWISELHLKGVDDTPRTSSGAYLQYIGRRNLMDSPVTKVDVPTTTLPVSRGVPIHMPPNIDALLQLSEAPIVVVSQPLLSSRLIASAIPFERLPSCPAKCGTSKGMVAVRVLRAVYGLWPETEGVAGMDEVVRTDEVSGVVEIGQRHRGQTVDIAKLTDPLIDWVMGCAMAPVRNYSVLVGVQLAFAESLYRNEDMWRKLGWEESEIMSLKVIAGRCEDALRAAVDLCEWDQVCVGFFKVRYELGGCNVDAGGGSTCTTRVL